MIERPCSRCGEAKALTDFYPDKSKRLGVSSACKACQIARSSARYWGDLDASKAYQRDYYRRNRDKWTRAYRALRERVLTEYGGACACCGETTPEFLAIDHVYNDGEAHRRELKGYGRSMYQWLRTQGFPKDGRFQLLCHNCNMAKGLYGACPHQREPERGVVTSQYKVRLG